MCVPTPRPHAMHAFFVQRVPNGTPLAGPCREATRRPYVPLRTSKRHPQIGRWRLCLHRRCMTSPDRKTALPRRHVVGLSLIAAIAVVLTGSIVVRALPIGPDEPASTPAVAQAATPSAMPSRVPHAQAPAPVAPEAAAGTPTQLPAPPPPMRNDNPPRHIASMRERPHPAPPHLRDGMNLPPLRAQHDRPPPRPHDHPQPGRRPR